MNSSPDKIIHEQIAELREERVCQESAALEAIRAIHRNPSEHRIPDLKSPSKGLIGKGPGAIAKFSPNGELIGWYREGQASGLPSQQLPIEKEVDDQYEAYYAMLREAIPPGFLASQLGQRSGASRRQNGLEPLILAMLQRLRADGIPRHHRAKLIATALECSIEHVRRVLRKESQ